jgi:prepilin-type N-terminal cleavage/methylation domain-containing protein
MRLPRTRPAGRGGFTLIEMLVVVAIIAILVALTAATALKFLRKGPELQTRNDISQLTTAVGTFKTKFGFYPPSRIRLCQFTSQYGNNGTNQLDADSQLVLSTMFPRCSSTWSSTGINWCTGSGNGAPNSGGVVLEGEECLVFFLGGVESGPNGSKCVGFSTIPTSPMDTSDMNNRIGPFFQCDGSRLVNSPTGNSVYVYNDPYGTPFAFFSSGKTRNGYNRYGSSDCGTLGVSPYQDTTTPTYYNPESVQIISAGANKQFGAGGVPVWTPATASQINAGNGADDISNFYDLLMGVSP